MGDKCNSKAEQMGSQRKLWGVREVAVHKGPYSVL